jgi:hypothetical protein
MQNTKIYIEFNLILLFRWYFIWSMNSEGAWKNVFVLFHLREAVKYLWILENSTPKLVTLAFNIDKREKLRTS